MESERLGWDEYFFNLIREIARKSKDPSTQVGCIIVSPENEFVSAGFNGFPRGVRDNIEEVPERYERSKKLLYTEHAERNAIYTAARRGTALDGCKMYVEWHPCADCMRGIIQTGIKEVVLNGRSEAFNNKKLQERWKDSIEAAAQMAEERHLQVRVWN